MLQVEQGARVCEGEGEREREGEGGRVSAWCACVCEREIRQTNTPSIACSVLMSTILQRKSSSRMKSALASPVAAESESFLLARLSATWKSFAVSAVPRACFIRQSSFAEVKTIEMRPTSAA